MKKKIAVIAEVIMVSVLAWVLVSFIEVNVKNLEESPEYCPINAFVILMESFGDK